MGPCIKLTNISIQHLPFYWHLYKKKLKTCKSIKNVFINILKRVKIYWTYINTADSWDSSEEQTPHLPPTNYYQPSTLEEVALRSCPYSKKINLWPSYLITTPNSKYMTLPPSDKFKTIWIRSMHLSTSSCFW